MNSDGSNMIPLSPPLEIGTIPAVSFSTDGRKMAIGCGRNVCIMNADGSNMIVLTKGWGPVFIR